MLHKIVYDVIFNPSKKWSRTGDGMVMIRDSQGRKSVDIPTNIFCQSRQFSDGYESRGQVHDCSKRANHATCPLDCALDCAVNQ